MDRASRWIVSTTTVVVLIFVGILFHTTQIVNPLGRFSRLQDVVSSVSQNAQLDHQNDFELPNQNDEDVAYRLDFEEFQKSGPAFDLFMQCQRSMMDEDESDRASYYAIADIHRKVFEEWSESSGPMSVISSMVHESVLFPVWHRPYLALYEQTLIQCASKLAKTYPAKFRPAYIAAASGLRLPYWDWAAHPQLPDMITQPYVQVIQSSGLSTTISNPLFRFDFPKSTQSDQEIEVPLNMTDYDHLPSTSSLPHTVRRPDSHWNVQHQQINESLRKSKLNHRVLKLFTSLQGNYSWFASVGNRLESATGDSLENLHNAIHQTIGGHMATNHAAFDPVFWMHHVYLDRLFAIWQVLFPDSYVDSSTTQSDLQGRNVRGVVTNFDTTTPLIPFITVDGKYHTAATSRDTFRFGYTYPDLAHVTTSSDGQDEKAKLTERLKQLYDTAST